MVMKPTTTASYPSARMSGLDGDGLFDLKIVAAAVCGSREQDPEDAGVTRWHR